MNRYTFYITLYDLIFFGLIILALNFALLLWFAKSIHRKANRFLSSALFQLVLWLLQIVAADIWPDSNYPYRDPQSMLLLLAIGPLIYFYVLKITRPDFKISRYELLHFTPLLVGQAIILLEINLIIQLLFFVSIISYLQISRSLINRFYRQSHLVLMDRSLLKFRWLKRLLAAILFLCLLWFVYTAFRYFYGHNESGTEVFDPFYIFFMVVWIATAAAAFLRSGPGTEILPIQPQKSTVPADLKEKSIWLRKELETKLFYQDPELSLASLARALAMNPHELSRVINTGLKKSFSDFINEYRVREVIQKMQDPACSHYTFLGIAYESGFNSKSTFNRIFKLIIGKSPLEYKRALKKEFPVYNVRRFHGNWPVHLQQSPSSGWPSVKITSMYMFRNYLKIAWRNLIRNKISSFINLGGLAVGMAVAMMIGLWISDELSFDKCHENHESIARVMQNKTFNGTVNTDATIPLPLDEAMRKNYPADFKHIVLTAWNEKHVLNSNNRNFSFTGNFMSPEAPEMLTLRMLYGNRQGLADKSSIFLSSSAAKALFGDPDPINKVIRIDNRDVLKITGVYDDLPENSSFHDLAFIGTVDYYLHAAGNERSPTDWGDNSLFMYVQMAEKADMASVSAKIRDIKLNNIPVDDRKFKPAIFLQPMSKWHLYAEFNNGVNTGGSIPYVRLFAIIGIFVLLLACINFMNLSTARSEKRAKEVGIRKAIGSLKHQLVQQFYWEAILIALLSFVVAIALLWVALSEFNGISGKQIGMPWANPLFWLAGCSFTLFTGILAGSYPALYLSSFSPVKVLKGTFKAGYSAVLPRKILVVTQFSISILLIVGVVVVFKQVEFAKNRPIGYNRAGLIDIGVTNDDLDKHFGAIRADLLSSGLISSIAQASGNTTGVNNNRGDIRWAGKDPSQADFFGSIRISSEYGKTVGWRFVEGHDFTAGNKADSLSVILNEAAAGYMKFEHSVGKIIRVGKRDLTVIGVVKNMVMESPYEPVKQAIFYLGQGPFADVLIHVNPDASAHKAIEKIAAACKTYSPSVPFSYSFVDDQYAKKFNTEERIGRLAGAFAVLAVFISSLGLFGMASFMAEQRVKEIGVRKILGASVFGLWQLMTKEFVVLVLISFLIAAPLGFIFMQQWLLHYSYRTQISWWIFAVTAAGALLITLLTISYQTIKAALANPVKNLRSE